MARVTGWLLGPLVLALLSPASASSQGASTEQQRRELARGKSLESEVEAELRRQEELLRSIDLDPETEKALEAAAVEDVNLLEAANTRIAPRAPKDRSYPLAIFDSDEITIRAGTWNNAKPIQVIRRSLDADRDGKPEEIRYFHPTTGQMFRKEADRDYDGKLDTWQTYSGGALSARDLDTDNDSKIDIWEQYRSGRMSERAIDRDSNGRQDAFYKYSGDSLVEERHDRNDDGKPDLILTYRDQHQIKKQEDRSKNGQIDTWVSYGVYDGKEIPAQIERDTDDSGKIDLVETFDFSSGKPILSKREEDKNGDGVPDITSIYKNGKLYRRTISDPDLVD